MRGPTWLLLAGLILVLALLAAWVSASNVDTGLGLPPPTGTTSPEGRP